MPVTYATTLLKNQRGVPINNLPTGELLQILDRTVLLLATDNEGIITYCNELFCEVSGYTAATLVGKSFEILHARCADQPMQDRCCGILNDNKKWHGEICATGYDGIPFWTQTTIVAKTDKNGAISGYVAVSKNITKHMLSVAKTDDWNEKYRNLFNYSPVAMWIYNRKTLQFMDVNQAAVRTYQYSREEFLGMNIKQIRPVEDIPKLEILLAKQRDTPFQNFKEIFTHTKKNGTNIYVNIQSNPIMFEGEPAIMVLANDVTEKLEAKVALSLANMRLTTAQEIAKLGYWQYDLLKNAIHWSKELFNIFELSENGFEPTIENISDLYHPDDRWIMVRDIKALFAYKEIDEFDNRIVTPDGKTKWIHQKIRLIRDSDNIPVAIEGVVQDVTETKEREQRLEESNERYRLIMKASSEALIDWDIVCDVTIWGDGFATIFGYDLSAYDNYLWSGNIHPDDREQVLKDLEQTLANPLKNVFFADFRYLKANREVTYVQHRGLIVRDKNGKPLRAIGSVMDMTEIMERNIKIENQNKAFREIAWIQSHKVRGPLSSLMGLVNILKMSPTDDISEDNLIEMIDIAANELDMIIHEIVEKSEKVVFDE